LLDVDAPKTLGMGAFGRQYALWRREQQEAMDQARRVIVEVGEEFGRGFGRRYGGLIDAYRCEDAEAVLVTMGAISGTARDVVDALRVEGRPVGLLKVRAYRPFPRAELRAALDRARTVAVVDRNLSFGYEGALASDLRAALYGLPRPPAVLNFIAGLGGSDVTPEQMRHMLEAALATPRGEQPGLEFVGL
jgi:pyruvate ferredoxin oxidoreductase alpha subunit